MIDSSVHFASTDNTETFSDEQVYIPSESTLKGFIGKTKRLVELSKKENLSFMEKKELEQLAESAHKQAEERLSDSYPKYRR